jgi:hypothetical protein
MNMFIVASSWGSATLPTNEYVYSGLILGARFCISGGYSSCLAHCSLRGNPVTPTWHIRKGSFCWVSWQLLKGFPGVSEGFQGFPEEYADAPK